jgi:hypothetical protein
MLASALTTSTCMVFGISVFYVLDHPAGFAGTPP